MNIFFLDKSPIKSAKMQCDKHVPKMCVETVQMLVSACRRHNWDEKYLPLTKSGTVHKGGYHNHPSTVWAGDCIDNFAWLLEHGLALTQEFKFRFGKKHACREQLRTIARHTGLNEYGLWGPASLAEECHMTDVPLCIGEELQAVHGMTAPLEDAVAIYREFYMIDKADFAQWDKGRDAPEWWEVEHEISYAHR